MLPSLKKIFETNQIVSDETGTTIPLHSHTSKEQGLFLQKVFRDIKPSKSIEIGFAYGISTMFILEMHRDHANAEGCHTVIEPDAYWGNAAIFNIERESLAQYLKIHRAFSDEILPALRLDPNERIQYAYIDTTKRFDIVFQDFYFIDKMLDVGGVVILDDCGGIWPGIQRVARYIRSLPHYEVYDVFNTQKQSLKRKVFAGLLHFVFQLIPFKNKIFPYYSFKSDHALQIDYGCIAFRKILSDQRDWKSDYPF